MNNMNSRQRAVDGSVRRGCGCGGQRNDRVAGGACGTGRTHGCSNRINARGESGGGCGCGCNGGAASSAQCKNLMRRLQVLDFSLQEIVLYLDVYPDCRRALDHFHRLRCEREQLLKEYETLCGPVCATGNLNMENWDWTNKPWPWEVDFVGNDKGQI